MDQEEKPRDLEVETDEIEDRGTEVICGNSAKRVGQRLSSLTTPHRSDPDDPKLLGEQDRREQDPEDLQHTRSPQRPLGSPSTAIPDVLGGLPGYDGSSVSHVDVGDFLFRAEGTDVTTTASSPRVLSPRSPSVTMAKDTDVEVSHSGPPNETEGISVDVEGAIPLNDEDPNLPFGRAEASSSSPSSDFRDSSDESDDEDAFIEVEQTKKAKKASKKAMAKVRPDPPGSSLSSEKSLRHLRKKCGISEEITLVAPILTDRADAPPAGYMTMFENYFD